VSAVRFSVPVAAVGVNQTYRVGRGRKVYKSREANRYRDAVIFAAKYAMRGREKFAGEVEARLLFVYPTARNDIDGAIKPTLDALNGIVWQDDRQVVRLAVEKSKAGRPRVEVAVARLSSLDAPVSWEDAVEQSERPPETAGKDPEAPP
jgi:Holliday junction resolvase RusA-like endonuclease